ncbi:glutaminase [Salibacter halophilus]|uniref:Glutaminase n=1 Tax=Salibacter halophilus TaxID=1803916 RepID=A0A6N6MBI5_9FLAO|nr:glutaminase [Salibacter halophilus]KAB1065907.1 glutaminase [Salibacter halophilus]
MNFEDLIIDVYREVENLEGKGETASYIPELSKVDPSKFGVHISTINGGSFGAGDFEEKFSIQSISKVLSLILAYRILDFEIWNRVGVEPSGTAFNSLFQLEADQGIPRNPFLNAGALVVTDILLSNLENPQDDFINFVRSISNNDSVDYSKKIAQSEKDVGYRNIALCNYIKSFGKIENEPADVLDFYYDICSLEMSCRDLSELFLFLANDGIDPKSNREVLNERQSKRVNALMQTCGFYDESGEFAFKVGLPGKSGVGGGIIAVHPDQYSIAVWSPKLNKKGNSYKGMRFLEEFTTGSELSLF